MQITRKYSIQFRVILYAMLLSLAIVLPFRMTQAQPVVGAGSYVVQARPILTAVTLGGTVIPARDITLSAQLPGRVEMIAGEEGDAFKKDTVLVRLDTIELMAQRRSAVAEWANAEANLRNAWVSQRTEILSPDAGKTPGGMAMPFVLDQMFAEPMSDITGTRDMEAERGAALHSRNVQVEQGRNAMVRARSAIDAIDAKLRNARGLAPFDGVITDKMVEIGDTVQPGQPLLKYADTSELQIQVEVPARLVPGLQTGMVLPAKLDVGGWVQVRVAQIFPIADARRHTVTVKFTLPQNTLTGAGQYAQVEIQDISTPAKYLPVIPTASLVWRGSLPGVYVLNDNKRELRLLRLGDTYGSEVTVLSGLKPGEVIELSPQPGVSSGWINPPQSNAK
ncbi:efflux RND transporter periplasmic adaptor subunit [Candidatus Venteria ishoeyi]|uniref:Putative efflux pump membrane fusion protein n=1 Tax=Candidatus Venteria ishoeyi TaxID=1899563 RepID=A0A1H6FGW8_9GAMM|nr:efflux RND transporter periplasmic adaptor subunit [Candidatus Venteria ishoeyi]MDM8546867.1 efflux RND transporter periplasmic adaptor subunit [Candidatus Venteria ishoeyi]SEH08681.1 putative efflux pump membrane fusion protein [Candidatus Venteria ishoeyi]